MTEFRDHVEGSSTHIWWLEYITKVAMTCLDSKSLQSVRSGRSVIYSERPFIQTEKFICWFVGCLTS